MSQDKVDDMNEDIDITPIIDLQNVDRFYHQGGEVVRALDDVSATINEGEYVAIIGKSGSGKSTLMNIIGCLDTPTGGEYSVNGKSVSLLSKDELAALRRNVFGFIFQRYNLLSNASALENVEIPAIYAGTGAAERRARALQLLKTLSLEDRATHKPGELSGGQQQRVSIARALMNGAEVILADEPTGALDSTSSEELLNLLEKLHKAGRTIIVITHDQAIADRAERTIEISDGKIVSDSGSILNVKSRQSAMETTGTSTFTQIAEATKMAVRALISNVFRTSLTLLGVIIGVASVVAMLAIGEGSQKAVIANIENMGSNLLFVQPGSPGVRTRGPAIATLTIEDALALNEIDNVIAAVPSRTQRETLRAGSVDYETTIEGVTANWVDAQDWPLVAGSFFSIDDENRRAAVVVLGWTAANNLFDDISGVVGEYILIGGAPFEVAGVLSPKGASARGQDMDDVALIPITTGAIRLFGQSYLTSITVAVEDTKNIGATETVAYDVLLSRHGTQDFQLRNTASLLESAQDTQDSFSLLLGSVAAISLLVGGIGIMNIMLVSVSERTREIGIRMANGAREFDVMLQFNTESFVLGGIGGLVGVLIGLTISIILGTNGIDVAITPEPAILAFSSALITGLLFGYLPARKASRLNPVVALSSE